VRRFCQESIDAAAIDRNAEIPQSVIDGLAGAGRAGHDRPPRGRRACLQPACLRSHHGDHRRALRLHRRPSSTPTIRSASARCCCRHRGAKAPLAPGTGQRLEAGRLRSDRGAGRLRRQQRADHRHPTPDGKAYILNGGKKWITNGGIADVLTVMARTPGVGASKKKEITAFLVTPDMPGFRVVEKRMAKNSIRGTATGRWNSRTWWCPAENILGKLGKGLRVALTVLDFGRTTFGGLVHGGGEGVRAGRSTAGEDARAVRPDHRRGSSWSRRRSPSWPPTPSPWRRDDGGVRQLHRSRLRGLHARDGDAQGVVHRCAVADRQRHDADLRRQVVLLRRAVRALDARRTAEPGGEGANDVLRVFVAMVGIKPLADHLMPVLTALSHPLRDIGTLLKFGRRPPARPLNDAGRSGAHQVPARTSARAGPAHS